MWSRKETAARRKESRLLEQPDLHPYSQNILRYKSQCSKSSLLSRWHSTVQKSPFYWWGEEAQETKSFLTYFAELQSWSMAEMQG